jgi:hypothetical protein
MDGSAPSALIDGAARGGIDRHGHVRACTHAEDVLRAADLAMYRAMRAGCDRVAVDAGVA